MKTLELNNKIKEVANEYGIKEYRIEGMKLDHGNPSINHIGDLVWKSLIKVKILPINPQWFDPIEIDIVQ